MERCAFCNKEIGYTETTKDIGSDIQKCFQMRGIANNDLQISSGKYVICEKCRRIYNLSSSDDPNDHSKVSHYFTDCLVDNPNMDMNVTTLVSDLMESPAEKKRKRLEYEKNKLEEAQREAENQLKALEQIEKVIVTTADIKQDYDVIGPVYYQISNKGLFSNVLTKKKIEYSELLRNKAAKGQASDKRSDWGFLYFEWSAGQNDFDNAFFIAVNELKKRAVQIGADAIVGMRQDIDIDTNGFAYFYLQMYGTAVKIRH